ncbi:MAG: ATP-binding protein [Thermoanaerobaculia bacterium]
MEDLSLHILDIVENSIRAKAKNILILFKFQRDGDGLFIEIIDDGEGMDEELSEKIKNPFYTTKEGKKFGLGIPFLKQSAEETGGFLKIESKKGKGTKISAFFHRDHIDMKPLGDLDKTLDVLKLTNPQINIQFEVEEY